MPQALSSKEAALFRQVIRNYEDKQYKRGLKSADLILKKNPKHGDTMAMKALIMNAQGKSEEAFVLAKEALRVDMKSHICWHVYGLLYRSGKNYEEAIKAYKFALKLEPDSHQIQRDLALLQIQMRDYHGYIQSRHSMLQARPGIRQSWTALAVAHHLAGNPSEAENILNTYEGTLKATPSRLDFENSEAVLYKISLIIEQGDYTRALEQLESAAKHNLDRLAVLEYRANCLLRLERKDEAVAAYRALLDRNSEHPEYYDKLIEASGIVSGDHAGKKALFDEYAAKSSRCDAARRLPLDFLSGDAFVDAARSYLSHMLNKGVPSTFANLKHLYPDTFKRDTLEMLAADYLNAHKEPSVKGTANGDSPKGHTAALYFLAQHYNYHLSRDLSKAMEYIGEAIQHEPNSVDLHMTQARIWKHRGDLQKASVAMDHARSLDTRDRYINTKAAKYQLRNDENERAIKTMGMFTRQDTVGGPLADLLDMQCLWFLTEDGESYARQGNTGLALKRFHSIQNIFDIWHEDQFDFHSFSLRKGLIRAYIDMMQWEDRVREHPFYSRAALDAVAIYLSLHDKPSANGVNGAGDENGDEAQERKKAAKRARKEQQRLEREAAEKTAKQDPNKGTPATETKKDDDPLGLKLAATPDPLTEAMKFVGHLLQFTPKSLASQLAGFDVYLRRKKFILALRCLKAMMELDAPHPKVHERIVEFQYVIGHSLSSLSTKVAQLIKADFKAIPANTDLKKYNDEFRDKNKSSAKHALSSIRCRKVLGEDRGKCEKDLTGLLQMKEASLEVAFEALETLKSWRSGEVEAFKKAAREKWPEVTRFA